MEKLSKEDRAYLKSCIERGMFDAARAGKLFAHIEFLEDALKFYADHNHWMQVSENAETALLLCAMKGPSPMQGYSVAEAALKGKAS